MEVIEGGDKAKVARAWDRIVADVPTRVDPLTSPRGKTGMLKLRRAFRDGFSRVGARWSWPQSLMDPVVGRLAETWRDVATPPADHVDDVVRPFVDAVEGLYGRKRDRSAVSAASRLVGTPLSTASVTDAMCEAYRARRHDELGRLVSARHGIGKPVGPFDAAGFLAAVQGCDVHSVAAMDMVTGCAGDRERAALRLAALGVPDAATVVEAAEEIREASDGMADAMPARVPFAGVDDAELARRRDLAASVGHTVTRRRVILPPVRVSPASGGPAFEPFSVRASMPWPTDLRTSGTDDGDPGAGAAELDRLVRARAGEVSDMLAAAVADGAASVRGTASPGLLDLHLARAMADLSPGGKKLDDDLLVASFVRDLRRAHDVAATAAARADAASALKRRAGLADYAALFPVARSMRRRMVLHVGPTNSGKTHAAMLDLVAAPTGAYLAPLRLMAMEAWDRLKAAGMAVSLSTGEEWIGSPGDTHVSSTVEMADLSRPVDVAVVDEVQLLLDDDRGWAWTQALFGMPARVLHLAGSDEAVSHVARVAASLGEDVEILRKERLVPLVALDAPVSTVSPGDAVVAFTRSDVLRLRAFLSREHRVATVYGSLSPEVRRAEAARFRSGAADVLVATDAIGLGLNLPIRRILFSTLEKYDGKAKRTLTPSEIRQVAGRAGRFGFADVGTAGVLATEAGGLGGSPATVARALAGRPASAGSERLSVMPPWQAVEAVAAELGTDDLRVILAHLRDKVLGDDPLFRPTDLTDASRVAGLVAGSRLPLRVRFRYLGCPVDDKAAAATEDIVRWSGSHGAGQPVRAPACAVSSIPATDRALQECESAIKRLTAYSWLALRFPTAYVDGAFAASERRRVNGLIESALARRVLHRDCARCGTGLPPERASRKCVACEARGRATKREPTMRPRRKAG